ncbi:MAG TPA: glycoside hydrolase family 3 N-terminal domain-containing protein [Candidatus Binatia bacterium]|nr:glycoside hydrolase family 3 N-terminal domain-containing protein [Candidatus Binatia bacterium]
MALPPRSRRLDGFPLRPVADRASAHASALARGRLGPLLLAVLLGACSAPSLGPSEPASPSRPAPSTSSSPPPAPSALPTVSLSEPTPLASCADRVLAHLSGSQRVGQLFAVGLAENRFDAAARAAVETEHFGSWWFTQKTTLGAPAIRSVTSAIESEVSEAATGGVGFFIAANQEGGQIQALAGPGFDAIPSALEQGTWPVATLQARAARWGRQLLAAGVNLDFAPVGDVVPSDRARSNAPIGALQREFGFEPEGVASHVASFVEGMARAGVVTTAKHFPGLGRVTENTDFAAGVVDTVTTVDDSYLEPFRRAVAAGVPAVMVSLATYDAIDPGSIAAFSSSVVGGLLRDDLAFEGLVLSDSLSAEAVGGIPAGSRAVRFLEAGGDLVVVRPLDVAIEMAGAVSERASRVPAFRARVDEAVLRVLRAKEAAGLLPC